MVALDALRAELQFDARNQLGEGPLWDGERQQLLWVDIEGGALHRYDFTNGRHHRREFSEMLSAVFLRKTGDLVMAFESGLSSYTWASDSAIPLNLLVNSDRNFRFNDGKCDPAGNIWIGRMHKEFPPHSGSLYKVDAEGKVSLMITGTTISNGMCWSGDRSRFYYIDSPTFEVSVYDYDAGESGLGDRRVLFKIAESMGAPDGMTIDTEGMLWIAHWGGHCVRRWDPSTGEVVQEILVDAPQVSSCCFGGPSLDTLYITTARSGLSKGQLERYPLSGGLFKCRVPVGGEPLTYCNLI